MKAVRKLITWLLSLFRRPSPPPVVEVTANREWPVVIDPTLITPEMEAEFAAQEPPPPANRQQRRARDRKVWLEVYAVNGWLRWDRREHALAMAANRLPRQRRRRAA